MSLFPEPVRSHLLFSTRVPFKKIEVTSTAGYKWALGFLFCLIVRGYQLGMIRAALVAGKVRYRTVLSVSNDSDCSCKQEIVTDGLLEDKDKPALAADHKQVSRDSHQSDLSADVLTIF